MDRRRKDRAESATLVLERAAHLPAMDRQLLVAIFADGKAAKDLSHLLGIKARAISKRCRALVQRIHSPEFVFIALRCSPAMRASWPAPMRAAATHMFVSGLSLSQTAAAMRVSYHLVRRYRDALVAMAQASSAAERTQRMRERDGLAKLERQHQEVA